MGAVRRGQLDIDEEAATVVEEVQMRRPKSLCDDASGGGRIDACDECASVRGRTGRQTPSTRHSLGRHRRDAASGRDWNEPNTGPRRRRPRPSRRTRGGPAPPGREVRERRLRGRRAELLVVSGTQGKEPRGFIKSRDGLPEAEPNNNAEADCDTALSYEPDHFK